MRRHPLSLLATAALRRHPLTLLVTVALPVVVALLAACSKPVPPPPEAVTATAGVALADVDLKNAPPPDIRQVPPPAGNGPAPDLTDLALATAQDGYAVTRDGTIAQTRDGGATWDAVYHLKGGRFSRVEAVDVQTAFAVAQTGCDPGPNCDGPSVMLATIDGGKSWTVFQPELPPIAPQTGLKPAQFLPWLHFQFLSAAVGYAAGDIHENALMGAPPLMVTRDGGRTWQIVKLPDGRSFAHVFAFTSPDRGYVTAMQSASGENQLLGTQDGGKSWQRLFGTREYGLYAVDFPTAKDGYIGGGTNPKAEAKPKQVLLATHDGGATWSTVSRLEDTGSPLTGLRMITPTEGWAAHGACWSMGASGSCGGPLAFTRDGGKSWTDSGQGVSRIRSVGQRAWVIDGHGGATTLLRTDDGGKTWGQVSRPDAVRVSQVRFLDAQVGFINTNLGLYQTTDAGKRWSAYPVGIVLPQDSWPHFLDRQTALAVTQRGLERSSDAGRTWQQVAVPLPERTDHIAMPALAEGSSGEAWLAMERSTCMNNDCPGFLVHSSDAGATWQPLAPGPSLKLREMAFADSLHGVGLPLGDRILLTSDGGKNWTIQPGTRGLMLNSASYAGSPDSLWLAGSYLTADYRGPGVLFHSTDGGQHWLAWLAPRISFKQIQFVTAQDGWAVTDINSGSGLLRTSDGGRTWTQVWPVLPMQHN